MITFAAASLEYLPSTERQHRGLVRSIVSAALVSIGGGRLSVGRALGDCVRFASERQNLVNDEIITVLKEVYFGRDEKEREAVLWLLTDGVVDVENIQRAGIALVEPVMGRFMFPFARRRFYRNTGQLPYGLAVAARDPIGADLIDRGESDPFSARIAVEWGAISPLRAFERHGIRPFFEIGTLGPGAFDDGGLARIVARVLLAGQPGVVRDSLRDRPEMN